MTETRSPEVRAYIHGMWASVAAAWDTNAEDVDRRAAAITERILDGVDLKPGDRVLELASGPGGAGLAAAVRVGAQGEVVISDVVPAMADIAGRRAKEQGLSNVRTAVLDLENIDEPDAAFDVVLCREGMMFALDPAHAAGEMHRVLRPNGRVAVAVWAARQDNPWLGLLLDAVTETTGIVVPPPGVPGPFALCDDDLLRCLFAAAGFAHIGLDRIDAALRSPSFDAWWNRNLTVAGPVVNILNRLDDDTRERLQTTVRAAITPYGRDDAFELPAVALVLTGRRS
jgi:ubiquinone/menaquinone biosynthesis C-methylase UbiE